MTKKGVLVFGAGFVSGQLYLAFSLSYRILKVLKENGFDVSSVKSLKSDLRGFTASLKFYAKLMETVQEQHPELLENEDLKTLIEEVQFYDITKTV